MSPLAARDSGPASVFVLPVLEAWLVHAPRHQVTALVDARAVEALAGGRSGGGRHAELAEALQQPPEPAPGPRSGPLAPQFLGLVTTRACNLACSYCGFGAACAAEAPMATSLAAEAVDWYLDHTAAAGAKSASIHFFGGEPLFAPEVLDVAVHRARRGAVLRGLTVGFEVSTNGVADEARCDFLGDYMEAVVLSFDGPQEVHDRCRHYADGRGSFEAVARIAHRLGRAPAKLCFRVCVTRESAPRLPEITAWFCSAFRPAVLDFEVVKPTPQADREGVHPPDPWTFAAACARSLREAKQVGVEAVYGPAAECAPRVSCCPVGNDTVIVTPDGRAHACYLLAAEWESRGLPLTMGRFVEGRGAEFDPAAVEGIRKLATEKPRCERCFCRWSCAGGCHVNQTPPGATREYDDTCLQTRLLTACRLLDDLSCGAWVDRLLADRGALERLALWPDDRLSAWEAAP